MTIFKLFWSSILTLMLFALDVIWRAFTSACRGVVDASASILAFIIFGLAGGGIVCGIYLIVHSFSGNPMAFLSTILFLVIAGFLMSAVTFLGTLLGAILELLLTLIIWILEVVEQYIERAHKSGLLFIDKQLKRC